MERQAQGAFGGRMGLWPWLLLACHAVGLAAFPPRLPTISDELHYVHQAVAFAAGEATVEVLDPLTGQVQRQRPSPYPPGTSLLLTPLVAAFGPAGAPWLGLLSLALMMGITGRMIARLGGRPGATVLLAAFLPSAVLCRHGMSDLPSGAWMACTLYLFFAGADGPARHMRPRWFAAGLLAGASVLLREANPLLVAPLFAGAVVRRERGVLSLIAGGLVGLGLRPLVMQALFGEPFYVKGYPGFSPANLVSHLPFYLALGSLLLPAGIPAALAYRGPRWQELVATTALWLLFFGCYGYAGEQSGVAKSIVVAGRFLIPITPLWVLALAQVGPRWMRAIAAHRPVAALGLDGRTLAMGGQAALAGLVLALHAAMGQWSTAQAAMRDAVYAHTPADAVIVPLPGTTKLINPVYGRRAVVPMHHVLRADGTLGSLLARTDLFVVELRRRDSEHWRRLSDFNDRLRRAVTTLGPSEQVFELQATATDQLIIWRVRGALSDDP